MSWFSENKLSKDLDAASIVVILLPFSSLIIILAALPRLVPHRHIDQTSVTTQIEHQRNCGILT